MPPKGSVKAKANAGKAPASKEPATPQPKGKGEEGTPKQTPKTGSATKPRARKLAKEAVKPFNALPSSEGHLAPVDVSYENETLNGKPLANVGGYGQDIRLRAHQPFSLVSTVMLTEGEHAGLQAVLLKPSPPFPFLKLPESVRARICRYYLAPAGKTNGKIDITNAPNGLSAKAYAAEAKPRLGLLCVNKEILNQARPILYSYIFRFDSSATVLAFLTCAGEKVRSLVTSVDVVLYAKANGMPMMTILSECKSIQRVHIAGGVGVNQNPDKAAKQFYGEAHRFLQVMGTLRGDKCAGIDLLSFGNKCFTIKDDEGALVDWDDEEVDDFTLALQHKLQ